MTFPAIGKAKESRKDPPPARSKGNRFTHFPWGAFVVAAIPVALATFYLTRVAPDLVPLPEGIKVPFPELTAALETACAWCGENQGTAWGIAGGLLAAGCLFRVTIARYYVALAIVAALGLGLTWYSISAPVDRVIKSVEDNIPKDHRVP